MKKDYSFGKTVLHNPFSRRKPSRKNRTYKFNGLQDTPKGVRYSQRPDGFVVSAHAPRYAVAISLLMAISVPVYIVWAGLEAEKKIDPMLPEIIGGCFVVGFFLGAIFNLVRRHKLVVRDDEFILSSGLGFLAFRQKEKLRDLRGAYVSRKVRGGPDHRAVSSDYFDDTPNWDGLFASYYLGVVLKDGSRLNALEGMSLIGLHYVSYALRMAVARAKR